ncbi:alpha/beta hydrolase family protein [Lactobacillus sp. ESL0791]|uniref:alpha/beta hydrolase n=1 Tax=Lactobacillus sp. ESL0791 TaxID=2983234 RepID=UPI0023F952FD|nr:alpha/beta hydrolase family protein [Lactobacillus sp. ESL0791]MDF7639753.1 alpha/beta hydrolase family protein [Lactobacillus sp. ESL0791]
MALIHVDFKSGVLDKSTSLYAITPEPAKLSEWDNFQILYLLHGVGDDHTKWIRRSNVEQWVKPYKLIVVSAQFEKSFYSNMVYGERYWDFLTEELPHVINRLFPISKDRVDHFVAGLSMGGFGAFKWALNYPEKFSNAASFSGVLDLQDYFQASDEMVLHKLNHKNIASFRNIGQAAMGEDLNLKDSINDLAGLIKEKSQQDLPKLYQFCGKQDPITNFNQKFRQVVQSYPKIQYKYLESDGNHDWDFWDKSLFQYLKSLPLKRI